MQDGSRWGKIGVTFLSEFKLVIHPFLCHIKNALAAAAAGLFSVDFTVLHAKCAAAGALSVLNLCHLTCAAARLDGGLPRELARSREFLGKPCDS